MLTLFILSEAINTLSPEEKKYCTSLSRQDKQLLSQNEYIVETKMLPGETVLSLLILELILAIHRFDHSRHYC
ncbi:hypothetical protein D3C81_1701450 [compost metagenome]